MNSKANQLSQSLAAILLLVVVAIASAAEPPLEREIFVPRDELQSLLENQPRRVFLSRKDYADLLAQAKQTPDEHAPRDVVLLESHYDAQLAEGRAVIVGTLRLEVLNDGLFVVPLEFSGVGLRRASLDGKNAPIGRSGDGPLQLFVSGRGPHELVVELTAGLVSDAAEQRLALELPAAPAAQMTLHVPGNVELKRGAPVVSRTFAEKEQITHLEILLPQLRTELAFTLNNRQRSKQRSVAANCATIVELAESHERQHVTCSFDVLHGEIDQVRFALPTGCDVLKVETPSLARWQVVENEVAGEPRILEVALREPTSQTTVVQITAILPQTPPADWKLARIPPLDVVGELGVVGLLAETRLQLKSIEPANLIPIDVATLEAALPASVLAAQEASSPWRLAAAYYAPQAQYGLAARFEKPPARLKAAASLLLTASDAGCQLHGAFSLLPIAERIFDCSFLAPPGWEVEQVTYEGQPLDIERYPADAGTVRIYVRLPQSVAAGETYTIRFLARHAPADWLKTSESEVDFPLFSIVGEAQTSGAIAVAPSNDLTARPVAAEGLVPLDENAKSEHGLGDVATQLAFRFDRLPFAARIGFRRLEPNISAHSFAFFRLGPDNYSAHYEVLFDIAEASTRELSLELPAETPAEVALRVTEGATLKQFATKAEAGHRRFSLQLGQAAQGSVRVTVDFQDRIDWQKSRGFTLPPIAAGAAEYQSGTFAIEGHEELGVEILTGHPRSVDVGELVDANYQPGRRLLGVFGFVGAPAALRINVDREAQYTLPSVLVERAELVTLLSANGGCQTAARYQLRSKNPLVEVRLPAGATLWSAVRDGTPLQTRRRDEHLLVPLATGGGEQLIDLQLVYEMPAESLRLWRNLDIAAPKLLLVDLARTVEREIPTADLLWHLHLPPGYEVARSDGSVFPQAGQLPGKKGWLVMNALASVATGPALMSASESASKSAGDLSAGAASEYYLQDDVQYEAASDDDRVPDLLPPTAGLVVDETESMFTADLDMPAEAAKEQTIAPARPEAAAPAGEPVAANAETPQPKPDMAPTMMGRESSVDRTTKTKQAYWALEGLRSLKIDLDRAGRATKFASLGGDPTLGVTVTNARRIGWLACAVALGAFLYGLALLGASGTKKIKYLGTLVLITLLFPLLTNWGALLGNMLDWVQIAAIALAIIYAIHLPVAMLCRKCSPQRAAVSLVLLAAPLTAISAHAEPPVAADAIAPFHVQVVPAPLPLKIPADAIVVPYDPEPGVAAPEAEQILVPYDKYVELRRRAFPKEASKLAPPPADYALAGVEYEATLAEADELQIAGVLAFELFTDEMVAIPLTIRGGVLTQALLDGKPAGLQAIQPVAVEENAGATQQQAAAEANHAPQPPLLQIVAKGKGRHELILTFRFPLSREGGWRSAAGRLPAQSAAALRLVVPQQGTLVRLQGVADRDSLTATEDGQTIATALQPAGEFRIAWRPRVAEAVIDRGLTADSAAVLDVQDDGLRLAWQTTLLFPGATREVIGFDVPAGYLIERVTGDNIRGWELAGGDDAPRLEVTLLKATRDRQQLRVFLSRRGPLDRPERASFVVPRLQPVGVSLHQGQILIRRSPLIELTTTAAAGAARDEPNPSVQQLAADVTAGDDSPLEARAYQTFRFGAQPPQIALSAAAVPMRLDASIKSILRVAEEQRLLECRAELTVRGRPLHIVRLRVPAELEIANVSAPGAFEWSEEPPTDEAADAKLVTIFLHEGQGDSLAIVINGRLGETGPRAEFALPRVEVVEAASQTTEFVLQANPSLQLSLADSQGVESVLPQQMYRWLQEEQRATVRLAFAADSAQFHAAVRVARRQPRVSATSITNVRVTDRAFEETIVLDYTIEDAGIREVSFLLPAAMKTARIQGPPIREKTITAAKLAGSDEDWVRVTLTFQQELLGQLGILISRDHLLTGEKQVAPVPVLENARVARRYVAVESAGRSEVVVESHAGLEPLSRQQTAWQTLAGILEGNLSHAYLAEADVAFPRLVLASKSREAVVTTTARIGLAETLLILDQHGNYRAQQTYYVDNRTEQFLEVALPAGAELWTVSVANRAVKPAQSDAGADIVRIPLVKTAAGDDDFLVILKYGGQLDPLSSFTQMQFPLVRTQEIQAERSQVRLMLPQSHQWRFTGKMNQVESESEFLAAKLLYHSQLIRRLTTLLETGNDFEKLRCANNLKQLEVTVDTLQEQARQARGTQQLSQALADNEQAWHAAEEQVEQKSQEGQTDDVGGNRARLEQHYGGQQGLQLGKVVEQLDFNFDGTVDTPAFGPPEDKTGEEAVGEGKPGKIALKQKWLEQNQLATKDATKREADRELEEKGAAKKPAARPPVAQSAPAAPRIAAAVPGLRETEAKEDRRRSVSVGGIVSTEGIVDHRRDQSRKSQVERYARQLDREAAVTLPQSSLGGETAARGSGGGRGAFRSPERGEALPSDGSGYVVNGPPLADPQQGALAGLPTGLASLDVELAQRGEQFLFTTALDDIEIRASAVSQSLIDRLLRLALVGVLLAVAVLVYRWCRRHGAAVLTTKTVGGALIVFGLIFLLIGYTWVLGLIALLAGMVILIVGGQRNRRLAAPAA